MGCLYFTLNSRQEPCLFLSLEDLNESILSDEDSQELLADFRLNGFPSEIDLYGDETRISTLTVATVCGKKDWVEYLLTLRDADTQSKRELPQRNSNLLMEVLFLTRMDLSGPVLECVELLLKAGANVNHTVLSDPPMTPLSLAAWHGKEMFDLLLRYGATLSQSMAGELTAAVGGGHLDLVQDLLSRGASPDVPVDGAFPIEDAVSTEHRDVFMHLLSHGADASLCRRPLVGRVLCVFGEEAAMAFIRAGADVHHQSPLDFLSPLSVAVRHGCKDVAKAIIEKGVNVNETLGVFSPTPLMQAGLCEDIEVAKQCIELLLENGADVSMLNTKGLNAAQVHQNYAEERSRTIELLLALQKNPFTWRKMMYRDTTGRKLTRPVEEHKVQTE